MNVSFQRLLGYRDVYGKPPLFFEGILANRIGREKIQQFTALLLTYCRPNCEPPLKDLIAMFFEYGGSFDQYRFNQTMQAIGNWKLNNRSFSCGILCEEALLNMYVWVNNRDNLKEKGSSAGDRNSPDLFKFWLLFNDKVLERLNKANNSIKKFEDKQILRMILAERFAQNDLIDIEYPKLIFCQCYKLMKLLNFLEETIDFQPLFQHLLNDFNSSSKEEFFKALGGAVITPLNLNKTGINSLTVGTTHQSQEEINFLSKLAHSFVEVEQGPTDYRILRDKPLQKISDTEYRIIFDLFLIKKLYNGIVFKLSSYVNETPHLIKGSLFGRIRDEFTEGILLYETMSAIFQHSHAILITGNEFKNAGLLREPDFYCRAKNRLILSESKDFFMKAEDKLSYDFPTIINGLSKDRLQKACLQTAVNVARALANEFPLDNAYDSSDLLIYPVIIVHDSLYNTLSLNYWVNEWFKAELDKLQNNLTYAEVNFSNVRFVTLIDIDLLILYQTNFENGELNLFDLLEEYQNFVDFNSASDTNYDKAIIPFSIFLEQHIKSKKIKIDFALLKETFKMSGFQE